MQIKMTSGGMKLLDHGTVFLAETNGDLRLNITADNAFAFTLVLQFEENNTETRKIETRVSKTKIELICKNFSADGTGTYETDKTWSYRWKEYVFYVLVLSVW